MIQRLGGNMNNYDKTDADCRRPHLGIGAWMFNLALLLAVLAPGASPALARDAAGTPIRIVAFGDSLTAGFGLKPGQAFPDILQYALKARGRNVEVVNAGVSGDTTAAGLQRLDWAIGADADAVIVELGANDALRGQAPSETKANLDTILARIGKRKLPVLIAGMRSPSNWGEAYRKAFDTIFADLADKHGAILYPFFLEGVATDAKLNLDDGLHPNARGIATIVEKILPKVEELIDRVATTRKAGAG